MSSAPNLSKFIGGRNHFYDCHTRLQEGIEFGATFGVWVGSGSTSVSRRQFSRGVPGVDSRGGSKWVLAGVSQTRESAKGGDDSICE